MQFQNGFEVHPSTRDAYILPLEMTPTSALAQATTWYVDGHRLGGGDGDVDGNGNRLETLPKDLYDNARDQGIAPDSGVHEVG